MIKDRFCSPILQSLIMHIILHPVIERIYLWLFAESIFTFPCIFLLLVLAEYHQRRVAVFLTPKLAHQVLLYALTNTTQFAC